MAIGEYIYPTRDYTRKYVVHIEVIRERPLSQAHTFGQTFRARISRNDVSTVEPILAMLLYVETHLQPFFPTSSAKCGQFSISSRFFSFFLFSLFLRVGFGAFFLRLILEVLCYYVVLVSSSSRHNPKDDEEPCPRVPRVERSERNKEPGRRNVLPFNGQSYPVDVRHSLV